MASYAPQTGTAKKWINIVAVDATLSNAAVSILNEGSASIRVQEGGSAPTTATAGFPVDIGKALNVSSTAIWVRSATNDFAIAITDTK